MRIPVLLISDADYVLPTSVAISSLIQNIGPETCYVIYVLGRGFSSQQIQLLKSYSSTNVEIQLIDCSGIQLVNLHPKAPSSKEFQFCAATESALLKFYIPELLPQEKKVIYLDGDVIVRRDLSDLYSQNIDSFYACAVKDSGALYLKTPIMEEVEGYFNSGVMLLNLEELRKDDITQKLVKAKRESKDTSLMDQNIFNIVFNRKVKFLPIKYNVLISNLKRNENKWSIEDLNAAFNTSYDSLEEVLNDSYILHYSSRKKPWVYLNNPYSDIWYKNFLASHIEPTVVTLTSYPARISHVHETIQSLLSQNLKPTKIVLWLASSQFPNKLLDLPESLKQLQSNDFEIRWCEDIKSYKKLIPALEDFKLFNKVTADDDILYPADWFEKLYLCYARTKHSEKVIWCHRAHVIKVVGKKVLKYKFWDMRCHSTEASVRVFCTTGGGVFFPATCFDNRLPDDYLELCSTADDIWFWGMLVLYGYRVSVVDRPMRHLILNGASQNEALWRENVSTQNDLSLNRLFDKYPKILENVITSPNPKYRQFGQKPKKEYSGLTKLLKTRSIMKIVNWVLPVGSERREFIKKILTK